MEQPIKTVHKDGTQKWLLNGKYHRGDGPARIWPNGAKEYWLQGIQLVEGSLTLKLVKERERRKEASDGTAS